MATVTLKGTPIHTIGDLPAIGTAGPDFNLVDGDLKDVSLASFQGKKKVLNIVPSLDTSVCATSTRKFNEKANGRSEETTSTTEGLKNVVPLSLMRSKDFGKAYGVLITDGPLQGITARAVVVLDEKDKVVYRQLVAEIGQEPDYDAALKAVAG